MRRGAREAFEAMQAAADAREQAEAPEFTGPGESDAGKGSDVHGPHPPGETYGLSPIELGWLHRNLPASLRRHIKRRNDAE